MKNRKQKQLVSIAFDSEIASSINKPAFTLIEVILVVVILAIAAMMALPFAASGATMQLRAAANIIAADIEYAKSMAISRGRPYQVAFDEDNEKYQIQIQEPNGVASLIEHPIKKGGADYIVDFSSDSRFQRIDIVSADFGGNAYVEFDYLGSPSSNGGAVTISAGDGTMIVNVAPVTGYITITE